MSRARLRMSADDLPDPDELPEHVYVDQGDGEELWHRDDVRALRERAEQEGPVPPVRINRNAVP
jgi:hypothetical protein